MVRFKTLKYKHFRRAQEILVEIKAGTATDLAADQFVVQLIEDWDYTDIETGQAIPIGELGELSLEQYTECMEAFNTRMTQASNIPKVNASPSPSGSTPLKRKKEASQNHRNG